MVGDTKNLYNCKSCLFNTLSCQILGDEEFENIRKYSIQLHFEKGETIFKQGGKSANFIFLHKGIVKFNYRNEIGKNFIMTIVAGPKLLGGANLFFRDTNIFSIVAVDECDLCMIDNRAFRNIMVRHGDYGLKMFEQAAEMFQASIFNFISLAHKQVNGRIADVLIYLAENVYKSYDIELSLTRKEIAEFASCSHENVITTLSRLNKEGVLTITGKRLVINDMNKLVEISRLG